MFDRSRLPVSDALNQYPMKRQAVKFFKQPISQLQEFLEAGAA
jgi:hypothetical protein